MSSILEQARLEGEQKARERYDATLSQIKMCEWDEARYDGYTEGVSEAPSRLVWFLLGALTTVLFFIFT